MIAISIVAVVIVAALVWNFVPVVREKLKGWSTMLEAAIGASLYGLGILSDAIQEAQKAGYLPSQIVGYAPYVIFAYIAFKRWQTKTPVGKRPS